MNLNVGDKGGKNQFYIAMNKTYSPKEFEQKWYRLWEERGFFEPQGNDTKELGQEDQYFSLVLPPPNVTGVLHMGHAVNAVLQDVLVRYYRMQGYSVLWMPGFDHAGIATQNVVEKALAFKGQVKEDLGKQAFIEHTHRHVEEHRTIILAQLKRLGISCDWQHQRFTLDEQFSQTVSKVFIDLYTKGLIYRGEYLVNWDPLAQTAISDEEVEYRESQGFLYTLAYILEGSHERVEVATTRPETIFGDVALAVHPQDERYQHLLGRKVQVPLVGRCVPIIADTMVDKNFGSGVVKITPAHDKNDFEMSHRHNLPRINILDAQARLQGEEVPQVLRGLSVFKAREQTVILLEESGALVSQEVHKNSIAYGDRSGAVIEPYLSKQWFVDMRSLAKKALDALGQGRPRFYPKRWAKTYAHWLKNIRPWCISRQLWWGHSIPVWYHKEGRMLISLENPEPQTNDWVQETDVLDTWFSSWLWPFAGLGWPKKTSSFTKFFPTSTLVTAYDILFFWVARMVMGSLEYTGEIPFKDVYITPLLRDKQGRKMSKSLGNGVDPIYLIDKSGSDALRFSLTFYAVQGQDIYFDESTVDLGSRFANKIWNAARYVYALAEGFQPCGEDQELDNAADRWLVHQLNFSLDKLVQAMESYQFSEMGHIVYHLFWRDFCDWYLEIFKVRLR